MDIDRFPGYCPAWVHPRKGTGIFRARIFLVRVNTGNNPCAHQPENNIYLWLSMSVNLKTTTQYWYKEACSGRIYVV